MSQGAGRGWRRLSLRARLTLLASAAVAVGLVAGTAVLAVAFTRYEVRRLDDSVRARAEVVRQLVLTDRLPAVLPTDAAGGNLVQVVDSAGNVLAASQSVSRTLGLLPPEQVRSWPRNAVRTYSDQRVTGESLRVVVLDGALNGKPVSVVSAVSLQDVQASAKALRTALALLFAVLVATVAAGSWALAGLALRPVEALRRGAERISDVGGGGMLPVPPGTDEVARLAGTLNRMLDRLADAGSRQRRFVADAAHELRSPVTALRTGLDVARAHPRDAGEAVLADELLPDVVRLGRLLDDLLVLARLDEGASADSRASAPRPVDLASLAREVADEVDPAILVVGAGTTTADPQSLRRILRNLLANARRHARQQVAVTVRADSVVVADDGPGIATSDRERVFARFTRLDDDRSRDSGGSGLGLAIARELARSAGGELTVDSADLGGAQFVLRLPAGPPEPGRPETAPGPS